MKGYKIIYLLSFVLLLMGCDQLDQVQKANEENNRIEISKLSFDSLYKNFQATVEISPNLSAAFLYKDSTIKIQVKEFTNRISINAKTQPELVDIRNIRKQELSSTDIDILALVDLTLDQDIIDKQKKVITDLKHVLPDQNIMVAFFKGNTITESLQTSDYVMNNYFKKSNSTKYFYKGLLAKYKEILKEEQDETIQGTSDSILTTVLPDQRLLIILSDGKVYDKDDNPIDPDHYHLQRSLTAQVDSSKNIPIVYINLSNQSDPTALETGDSDNLLRLLCLKSNGKYIDTDSEDLVIYNLLDVFKEHFSTYTFYFQNPDKKIYRGAEHLLEISCYREDSLLASDNITYFLGSVYNPIIVNGKSTAQIVIIGILIGALIILVLYLIFQYLVPFIQYQIFKKKYVTHYTGSNMCFNDILVNEECYFCKAPFEEGDEIVAKCKHVVHKSCWDENRYKCPEYGLNCKTGSHYYNHKHLYDYNNAPYYCSWILAGALAGLISWIFFITQAHNSQGLLFAKIIPTLFNVEPTSEHALVLIEEYGSHLLYLPFYGFNMGLFLTLVLSVLTGHGRWWWKRLVLVLIKTLLGGFFGCLSFIIGSVISIALNFTDNSFLIDWIPWLISGCSITLVIAFGTDIKLKKALIGAAVSVVLGLGSTYLWTNPVDAQLDSRTLLLIGYMIYCIGFAYSIAITYPKSERYFLRVEGPIKEMDLALYKWMNAQAINKHIIIGKSVDCELQMTWDITSQIAPKQAKVYMKNGNIYLEALEDGVYVHKKILEENRRIRLYHGTKFIIGKTIFTYLEKDL